MQNDNEDSYTHLRHADATGKPAFQHDVRQLSQHSGLIPSQKYYGSIHMVGGSLHQGDQYYFTSEDVAQKEVSRFVDSLWFPEINLRTNQIADAHQETFQWALEANKAGEEASDSYTRVDVPGAEELYNLQTPGQSLQAAGSFGAWILSDESMFWVAGKPGSGKSTLMKFLSFSDRSKSLLRRRFHNQDVLILRHFFWLHGSEMQKSMKGCLCALIRQVLQNNDKLVLTTLRKKPGLREKRNTHDWSDTELQELLYDLLGASERALGVFLDGLDEYDTHCDVRALLEIVQRLSGMCNVKVCCSSRQENVFERAFLQRPKLRLQDLTYSDMQKMARAKIMVEMQDAEAPLTTSQLDSLSEGIASQAEGVFLWATVAIRALTLGIRDCDNYETLSGRLNDLPPEMEDLCSHLLTRVNATGRRNLDTCLKYLTLANVRQMSLLTFTLAADEALLQRYTHNQKPITLSEVQQLLQACRTMVSQIRARTAGILEVVDPETDPSPVREDQTDDPDPANTQSDTQLAGLCTCARSTEQQQCFVSIPYVEGFPRMYHKNVQFMHRDIAKKLDLAKTMNLSRNRKIELRLQARKRFMAASLVEHKLGRRCDGMGKICDLFFLLRQMGENDASATMQHLFDGRNMHSTVSEERTCYYGWAHEVFYPLTQVELRMERDSFWPDNPILDFPGLMAWLGYLSFFDSISYDVSTWSSYYKGYLCACAAKREYFPAWDRKQLCSGNVRVMCWLIENGANLLSPQVARTAFGRSASSNGIVVQPPIVDCWCFILRLLESTLLGREEKLRICDELVPLLLAQKCWLEDSVAWSVVVNTQKEGDEELLLHNVQGHDLEFVMRTTIHRLQVCVLESISYLREGHAHKRAFPSLEMRDVHYLFWIYRERDKESENTFFVRRHLLDFNKLKRPQFKTLETTAFEVLVHRGTTRLRSMQRLIHELDLYVPHCTCRDDHKVNIRLSGSEYATLVAPLNVAPYRSFYMYYDIDIRLVPPDRTKELHDGQWYEHGALREWHERRRREMWMPSQGSTSHLHKYEEVNQAIRPSYLPQLIRTGSSLEAGPPTECQNIETSLEERGALSRRQSLESINREHTEPGPGPDSDGSSSEIVKSGNTDPEKRKRTMKSIEHDTDDYYCE